MKLFSLRVVDARTGLIPTGASQQHAPSLPSFPGHRRQRATAYLYRSRKARVAPIDSRARSLSARDVLKRTDPGSALVGAEPFYFEGARIQAKRRAQETLKAMSTSRSVLLWGRFVGKVFQLSNFSLAIDLD